MWPSRSSGAPKGTKLTLNLGDEIPVLSTVFGAAAAGGFASVPQSSFNYRTVGIILEMTPRVTYDGEIVLDAFSVESSALGATISVAGQDVPSFASRKVTTKLRLREGESTLLAGLLKDEQRKILTGFPGVMQTPDPAVAVRTDERPGQPVRHRDAAHAAYRPDARAHGAGSVVDLHRDAAEHRARRTAAAHRPVAGRRWRQRARQPRGSGGAAPGGALSGGPLSGGAARGRDTPGSGSRSRHCRRSGRRYPWCVRLAERNRHRGSRESALAAAGASGRNSTAVPG